MSELADRLRGLNEDSRYLVRISVVAVFGHYLAEHDPIQDIDLGIELQPKHSWPYRREARSGSSAAFQVLCAKILQHWDNLADRAKWTDPSIEATRTGQTS